MKQEYPKMIYKKGFRSRAKTQARKQDYCIVKSEKEMLALGDEWEVERPAKKQRQRPRPQAKPVLEDQGE